MHPPLWYSIPMGPGNEDTIHRVAVDPGLCRKDGLCVRVCRKVFSQEEEGSAPVAARPEFCNSCGHCVLVCPSGRSGLRAVSRR